MFDIIRELIDRHKMAKQRLIDIKKTAIRNALIRYYEDLQKTMGGIDLPPFILADMAYSRGIKTEKDIHRAYAKLVSA